MTSSQTSVTMPASRVLQTSHYTIHFPLCKQCHGFPDDFACEFHSLPDTMLSAESSGGISFLSAIRKNEYCCLCPRHISDSSMDYLPFVACAFCA